MRRPSKLIDRLFHRPDPNRCVEPLYHSVIAHGRAVHWYVDGAVPDTLDGRFDMISAIMVLVLIRLEEAGLRHESVWLTELFIDDMEAQLREMGIGDVAIGKHVGRMMSALGGRLCVYRGALRPDAPDGAFRDALVRNLYRGEAVDDKALADVEKRLRLFAAELAKSAPEDVLKGNLPS